MLRATDRTSRIRLPLSVLGALWLALLALFALLAASQATGSAHVTDENDHLILRRPHTRSGAFQPGDRSGLPNLSTWLIVALVAAAFADRKSTRLNSSHVAISYAVFRSNK